MSIEHDRIKGSLRRIVRLATAGVDYHAHYACKVVSQNADGTLELHPDEARIGDTSKVPIRLGIPGAAVKVAAGSRVMVGFENGDPARPVATLWEASSVQEIVFTTTAKVTIAAPVVNLAGEPAIDAVLKGTTYRTLEGPAMTSLSAALTAIGAAISSVANIGTNGAAAASACSTAAPLITALGPAADTAVLSTKVKTQ